MSTSYYHCSLLTSHSELSTQNSALVLLIGLPGSGKSTLAKQLIAECPQMQLISTDAIRGQLFGDEIIQGPWFLIWQEVERQLKQTVTANKSAIFDATNARRRDRRELITLARNLGFTQVTGIWLTTPVWLCLARNKKRSRRVPEEVIFRMHRQLRDAPPSLVEGLDCLMKIG